MVDKYCAGQDPYCYPGTDVLRNRLNLTDDAALLKAERELSEIAASEMDFIPPPYDLTCFQKIHRSLFSDIYEWAGEIRTIDISKGSTRFCHVQWIEGEAAKLFRQLASKNWFEQLPREQLVVETAELYGDLNVVHPFREGNGRAQRLLFEHLVINAGYQINWWHVDQYDWIQANIDAYHGSFIALEAIFDRCIGQQIA